MQEFFSTNTILKVSLIILAILFIKGIALYLWLGGRRKQAPELNKKTELDQVVDQVNNKAINQSNESQSNNLQPHSVEPAKDLDQVLKNTESHFFGRIKSIFSNSSHTKDKILEELEEILYTSDLGPKTVQKLLAHMEQELSSSEKMDLNNMQLSLKRKMQTILGPQHEDQIAIKNLSDLIAPTKKQGLKVLMIVGVNGAGKTTSIGKITAQLVGEGKKVLVAAGDTFRAAAGGQLKIWTDRASHLDAEGKVTEGKSETGKADIFWPDHITDPGAVAFEALTKAKNSDYDFVILDTAGRLHTQTHLMEELKKVKRVMKKVIEDSPDETWIVLDANSGQNALNQAAEYDKALEISGVILTKMDGTAKGGVALGVVDLLGKPIRLVGIGEKVSDLKIFNYHDYIKGILGK